MELRGIDANNAEKIGVVGQNMGKVFAHVKSLLKTLENLRAMVYTVWYTMVYGNQRQATATY